ncbi:hypothetical protein A2U01_0106165, partial [Trifolium medium]|nr:hypothetical protein [Trifolium medium]
VSKLKKRMSTLEGELKLVKEEVVALGGEKTKMEDFVRSSRQWPLVEERPPVCTSDELAGLDQVALIAEIYEL